MKARSVRIRSAALVEIARTTCYLMVVNLADDLEAGLVVNDLEDR